MVRFFVKCGPSVRESIKVCRGEQSWLECAKGDDVDALSYTLASGKGSRCAWQYFHCFKESEKSLNETPMWSSDCGGMSGAPCWVGGQRSKGHPHSMDGAEGSQTYQYMHGIYHSRGLRVGAAKARKPRWISNRG